MNRAAALDDYLRAQEGRAFDWGDSNCCHFPAGWVEVREGRNPMQGLPSTPTRAAARRLVRELGGSLQEAWTCRMNAEATSPKLAQIGDIVLVALSEGTKAVGICAGIAALCLDESGARRRVSMDRAIAAWRVQ